MNKVVTKMSHFDSNQRHQPTIICPLWSSYSMLSAATGMSITLTLDKRPESWTRGQNQFVQISCKCKSLHLVPCHDSDAFTWRVIHKDCASIRRDSDAVCPDKADQILLNYQSMLHLLKSAYNIAKMCYFDFLLLSANIPRTNLKSPFICCWDTWVCWLTPPWENRTYENASFSQKEITCSDGQWSSGYREYWSASQPSSESSLGLFEGSVVPGLAWQTVAIGSRTPVSESWGLKT